MASGLEPDAGIGYAVRRPIPAPAGDLVGKLSPGRRRAALSGLARGRGDGVARQVPVDVVHDQQTARANFGDDADRAVVPVRAVHQAEID